MKTRLPIKLCLTGLLAAGCSVCGASERAILRNGFNIVHSSSERRQGLIRLFLTSDKQNYVDVPSADVLSVEPVDVIAKTRLASKRFQMSSQEISAIVGEASERHLIDPALIRSIIRAESDFNSEALSSKGARGLMQLMPGTANSMGVLNPYEARANVDGGTRYFRQLMARYHNNVLKALAAYNAGPARVDRYRGIPPYRETKKYVRRVIMDFNRQKQSSRLHWASSGLVHRKPVFASRPTS